MKPKKQEPRENGPGDQNEDFEKSPDMVALDVLARNLLKAGKHAKVPVLTPPTTR
jgi:hypothetical protein